MVAIPKLLLLWTALFYVVFALPALFMPASFRKAIDKYVKNEELVRIGSVIAFIFGFLYLLVYVKFDGTWYMIFSIFGFLCLLKGVVHMWFPSFVAKKAKMYYGTNGAAMVMGIIMLILAGFLARVAFAKF